MMESCARGAEARGETHRAGQRARTRVKGEGGTAGNARGVEGSIDLHVGVVHAGGGVRPGEVASSGRGQSLLRGQWVGVCRQGTGLPWRKIRGPRGRQG
jgi:hypothetical protein